VSADKKKFLLRIDQQLYDQIATAADNAGNSVNAYIEQALTRALHQPSFEQRQVVGQTVAANDIVADSGLVLAHGIYYRYITTDNAPIAPGHDYAIVAATGNILTLQVI
jgi:hypothetical protein